MWRYGKHVHYHAFRQRRESYVDYSFGGALSGNYGSSSILSITNALSGCGLARDKAIDR